LFELGGVEIILGVAWLAKLGGVRLNWKTLSMSFMDQGRMIYIKGDPSLSKKMVNPQSLRKEKDIVAISVCWRVEMEKLDEMEARGEELIGEQKEKLEKILQDRQWVFAEPRELPPRRAGDHKNSTDGGSGSYKCMDGSWRFCVDYRALNKATIPNKFPIPVIEELLDELYGASCFSKIDLKAGYHQIRMQEYDIKTNAFRTHQGHYESLVMPFGLTNAPATFQCAMNEVLRDYLRKFLLVFFDDILIYSKTWEDHVGHLKIILKTLQRNSFYANMKKCEFGKEEMHYLGHVVSREGVRMDPQKVAAIKQ